MDTRTKVLLFSAGVAVGALAGLLVAPDKGSEVRKKISKRSKDFADSIVGFYDDIKKRFSTDGEEEEEEMADASTSRQSAYNGQ